MQTQMENKCTIFNILRKTYTMHTAIEKDYFVQIELYLNFREGN